MTRPLKTGTGFGVPFWTEKLLRTQLAQTHKNLTSINLPKIYLPVSIFTETETVTRASHELSLNFLRTRAVEDQISLRVPAAAAAAVTPQVKKQQVLLPVSPRFRSLRHAANQICLADQEIGQAVIAIGQGGLRVYGSHRFCRQRLHTA